MIEQPDKSRAVLRNLDYYWFVGCDQMTASHLARTGIDLRDRLIRGYDQRWAYVTVTANVTQGWARPHRSEQQTAELLEKFIKDLGPKLTRPDGTKLL